MIEKSREEIEKKLEQSRRLGAEELDPTTKARLKQFVRDLEAQLRDLNPLIQTPRRSGEK